MSWFKVDDKFHDHKKVRDPNLSAVGLWLLAGSWAGDNKTDGFVPESVIRRWGATKKQAEWLVDRGLFEPTEVDGEQGWMFHDWDEWQPEKADTQDALGRARWARKTALSKNRRVLDAVIARDGCLCRYCGVTVNFADRRSGRGGTYDHVNPNILDAPSFPVANSVENIVVACRKCNGRKRDRTPEQAAMPLLPPGTTALESELHRTRSNSGVKTDLTPELIGVESDQPPAHEAGRSQVGVSTELTPESGRRQVGSGQDGPGQAPAGDLVPHTTTTNGRTPS